MLSCAHRRSLFHVSDHAKSVTERPRVALIEEQRLEGRRAPQGLGAEDRLAFGLTASHLSYLVFGSLGGYAFMASGLTGLVKYPFAFVFIGTGALLAWGRVANRSIDTWAWLAARYYLRPRRSAPAAPDRPARVLNAESDGRDADPPPPALGSLPGADDAFAREGFGADAPADDDAGEVPPPQTAPEMRILTLPSAVPQVADGAGEYRVAVAPMPEPEVDDAPPSIAPVFLASTQRIAFFSLKGGVGKTTLATEVAVELARRGRFRSRPDATSEPLRVALLDLDLGSANVSMKLGLTHPTLWDLVVEPDPDRERIDECMVWHDESGLRALLGPPRAIAGGEARSLAMQRLAQVLSYLDDERYHFVFMDLSSDVDDLTTYALEAAHQVYYVLTPTASAVQDTYRGVETLRRLGHRRKLRFVLNQERGGFNADEMMADLGGTLAAVIPRDDAFNAAEDDHRPLALAGSGAGTRAIRQLASAIYPTLEVTSPKEGLWRRLRRRVG